MKARFALCLILFALSNCQTNSEQEIPKVATTYTYRYSLVEQGIKHIKIDSTTRNRLGEYRARLWESVNGKQILGFLNAHTNKIQLYNWASGKLETSIQLQAEGPNAVGKPRGFWVLNDSIWAIPHEHTNSIMLVNGKGNIVRKYNQNFKTKSAPLPGQSGYVYSAEPMPSDHLPMLQVGANLLFGVGPDLDPRLPSFFEYGKVSMVLDTATGLPTYHTRYPASYRAKGNFAAQSHYDVSWAYDPQKGKITYSFPADVHLHITDTSFRQFTAHEAKSRLVDGPVKFKDKPEQDEMIFYMDNYHFKSLFFDTYRRVYYRLVRLPARSLRIPTEQGSTVVEKALPVSVIILNDQHQIIGETLLPYPLGMVGAVFIDREGLWIEGVNPASYLQKTGRNHASEDEIYSVASKMRKNANLALCKSNLIQRQGRI